MKSTWRGRLGVVMAVGIMVLNVWLVLMPGGAFAKDKSITDPRVEDANNKLVGSVIGLLSISNPVVALNVSIPNLIIQVLPNNFVGNYPLLFTTGDCSGQPYFDTNLLSRPHTLPIVGVVNRILYEPRANSASVSITRESYSDIYTGDCTVGDQFPMTGIIADPIIDLSTQFTPPFRFVYP